MARSAFVIHTDDDCVVPTDWVSGMAAILDNHPDVGLVFCNVMAASHDQDAGYIPAYEQSETRILRSPLAICRGRGIGAGMGFRRDAVLEVGGVDGMMGAGGRFPSAEDMDVALRMLLKGWHVIHTAEWAVVHYGFRTFAEGRDHTKRDWLGIGACLGKLFRTGHPVALVLAVYELAINAVKPALLDMMSLRRPRTTEIRLVLPRVRSGPSCTCGLRDHAFHRRLLAATRSFRRRHLVPVPVVATRRSSNETPGPDRQRERGLIPRCPSKAGSGCSVGGVGRAPV